MGSENKNCPYCGEQILAIAIKCKHCGSMLTEFSNYSSTDPITFVKLALASKYEILNKIGEGGMADVFKANQKTLNRIVALKVIHQNLAHDKEFLDRFHREAKIASSLNHPNIVSIYDEGIENGVHYIAMEYLEDGDLHSRLMRKGKLSVKETEEIIIPIADALDHAHRKNIIHRDIKSGNILFTITGRPVLTDFGIAHAASGTKLTQTGSIIGTPEYMSPEQAEGKEIDHRSDLYSLGVVMYECLTGKVPFKGDNPITTIYKIINEKLDLPYSADEKSTKVLKSLIREVLEKSPILRINSGKKFKTLFEQTGSYSSYTYQSDYKTEKLHKPAFDPTNQSSYSNINSEKYNSVNDDRSIFSENHYSEKKTDLGLKPLTLTLIIMVVVALVMYGIISLITQNSRSKEISGLLNQAEKMIESGELSQYTRAYVIIQNALELDPNNSQATVMTHTLYNELIKGAEKNEKNGDINSAIEFCREAVDVKETYSASNKLNSLIQLRNKLDGMIALQPKLKMFSKKFLYHLVKSGYSVNRLLLYDSFDNNKSGWNLVNESDGHYLSIMNGRIYIEERNTKSSFWPELKISHKDFISRIVIKWESGKSILNAGFYFRSQSDINYATAVMLPFPEVSYYHDGWHELGSDFHPYVIPENDNIIEVMGINNQFLIFINGVPSSKTIDVPKATGNSIGILVSGCGAKFSFDDFLIFSLKKQGNSQDKNYQEEQRTIDPETIRLNKITRLLNEAQSNINSYTWDAAIQKYDEVLRVEPSNSKARNGKTRVIEAIITRGDALYNGGFYSQAYQQYQKALSLRPGDTRIQIKLTKAEEKKL